MSRFNQSQRNLNDADMFDDINPADDDRDTDDSQDENIEDLNNGREALWRNDPQAYQHFVQIYEERGEGVDRLTGDAEIWQLQNLRGLKFEFKRSQILPLQCFTAKAPYADWAAWYTTMYNMRGLSVYFPDSFKILKPHHIGSICNTLCVDQINTLTLQICKLIKLLRRDGKQKQKVKFAKLAPGIRSLKQSMENISSNPNAGARTSIRRNVRDYIINQDVENVQEKFIKLLKQRRIKTIMGMIPKRAYLKPYFIEVKAVDDDNAVAVEIGIQEQQFYTAPLILRCAINQLRGEDQLDNESQKLLLNNWEKIKERKFIVRSHLCINRNSPHNIRASISSQNPIQIPFSYEKLRAGHDWHWNLSPYTLSQSHIQEVEIQRNIPFQQLDFRQRINQVQLPGLNIFQQQQNHVFHANLNPDNLNQFNQNQNNDQQPPQQQPQVDINAPHFHAADYNIPNQQNLADLQQNMQNVPLDAQNLEKNINDFLSLRNRAFDIMLPIPDNFFDLQIDLRLISTGTDENLRQIIMQLQQYYAAALDYLESIYVCYSSKIFPTQCQQSKTLINKLEHSCNDLERGISTGQGVLVSHILTNMKNLWDNAAKNYKSMEAEINNGNQKTQAVVSKLTKTMALIQRELETPVTVLSTKAFYFNQAKKDLADFGENHGYIKIELIKGLFKQQNEIMATFCRAVKNSQQAINFHENKLQDELNMAAAIKKAEYEQQQKIDEEKIREAQRGTLDNKKFVQQYSQLKMLGFNRHVTKQISEVQRLIKQFQDSNVNIASHENYQIIGERTIQNHIVHNENQIREMNVLLENLYKLKQSLSDKVDPEKFHSQMQQYEEQYLALVNSDYVPANIQFNDNESVHSRRSVNQNQGNFYEPLHKFAWESQKHQETFEQFNVIEPQMARSQANGSTLISTSFNLQNSFAPQGSLSSMRSQTKPVSEQDGEELKIPVQQNEVNKLHQLAQAIQILSVNSQMKSWKQSIENQIDPQTNVYIKNNQITCNYGFRCSKESLQRLDGLYNSFIIQETEVNMNEEIKLFEQLQDPSHEFKAWSALCCLFLKLFLQCKFQFIATFNEFLEHIFGSLVQGLSFDYAIVMCTMFAGDQYCQTQSHLINILIKGFKNYSCALFILQPQLGSIIKQIHHNVSSRKVSHSFPIEMNFSDNLIVLHQLLQGPATSQAKLDAFKICAAVFKLMCAKCMNFIPGKYTSLCESEEIICDNCLAKILFNDQYVCPCCSKNIVMVSINFTETKQVPLHIAFSNDDGSIRKTLKIIDRTIWCSPSIYDNFNSVKFAMNTFT